MLDLIAEHKIAMSIFELGQKSAADLHFSGKLQIDSLGDLVVDVPSALLRGCFSAIKEPGAELCVGSSWKARFIVMDREEVETIGSKAISERGKDFDFKINGSSSSSIDTPDISKIWYLDIDCPDAERIRQSYGLKGKPETGFRALFGVRRKRLFTNSSVSKDVKWAKPDEKPGASSGEWKWTKMADLLPSVQLQPHQQALAEEIDPEHPVKKLLMWQVGSGKCVRGNTSVVVDSKVVAIESLFKDFPAGSGWFQPITPISVAGYKQGNYEHKRVRRLYREELTSQDRTLVLITDRGNTLEPTKEHEFFIFRDFSTLWVRAEEVLPGDLIAVAADLPAPVNEISSAPSGLAELLAWQVTEGYENPDEPWMSITQDDVSILERLQSLFKSIVPQSPSGHIKKSKNHSSQLVVWCAEYKRLLEANGYIWGKKAANKALPSWIYELSNAELKIVLRALFDAEGHAAKANLEFSSASKKLLTQVQYLLLRFGIRAAHKYKWGMATNGKRIKRRYGRLTISGEDLETFSQEIGFSYAYKQEAVERAAAKKRNPNCGVPASGVLAELADLGLLWTCAKGTTAVDTVSTLKALEIVQLIRSMLAPGGLAPWEKAGKRCGAKARQQCAKVISTVIENKEKLSYLADVLEKTLGSNLRFERVASIESGEVGGFVYDIEVESDNYDDANYIAGIGGFIVHNSLGSIAGAEAYGKPYTVIGPAAMRPSFKSEQKRFTDRALPSEVISYHKAVRSGVPNPESLVFDEAQRIINPSSGQSQAAVEAARNAKQVLMLSGTPVVNRPGDLAPMVNVLTGKNFSPKSFEDRYLDRQAQPRTWSQWAAGQPIQQNPVVRNREELKALLAGKVDWYAPDKPMVDTRYSDHEVEMSPEQTKLYNAMFGKMPLRLRMGMDNLTSLTPKELLRLQAFLAGPRQVGLSDYPFAKHRDPMQSFSTSAKLQLAFNKLKEKLDGDPRTKGIVYSNFPRAGLEPYRAALQQHNIPHTLFDGSLSDNERAEAVRSFNEGRSRVALVGPAGAEGISLRGAQLLQQLDPHWQDAKMRQSAARGIRFDSHTHLPEELRNIEVQRFISKLPPKAKSILQSLHLVPYREKLRPGSDDYLRNLAEDKEKSNRLFMELLKEVGQRKQAIFSLPAREVVKTANLQTGVNALSLPAVKIDRPRGFQKTFQTPKGPLTTTYPVDYGYFDGYINPEDKDGADVFMGTGGATGMHGRFMKGKNLTGKWEPDERKWYANLTPAEHKAVLHFYHQQDPTLLADHVSFKTHKDLIDDLNSLRAAVPSDPKGMTLENVHKLAQMVSVPITESCQECRAQVTTTTTDLDGSKHVNCSNCGKKTYILMHDGDRKSLLEAAAKATHCEPSKEQMEAGNYSKGKFGWHDLVIALESPKDSVRKGVTKAGKSWETKMKDHYGHILKHISEADGDHVDVFVASDPDFFNTTVYVIDQFIGGKFDEHKVVILAGNAEKAKQVYLRNYQSGWTGFGNISTLSLTEFKDWLENGTGKPVFVKVPVADAEAVRAALNKSIKALKQVKNSEDDSGGGYGDVILCTRQKKLWLVVGDWWSKPVIEIYKKELQQALPTYECLVESESMPTGYESENKGDWCRIKAGEQ